MASLNTGLNTALSGLSAAQTAMSVTSHNISNASTPGYTRESVDLKAIAANGGSYQWISTAAVVGNGVDSSKVTQTRNMFLDIRYRAVNSQYSDYNLRGNDLNQVEDIFNDTTDNNDDPQGLTGQLNTLINSLRSYQTPPISSSLPGTIQSDARNLATAIRDDYSGLTSFESQEQGSLNTLVTGGTESANGGINGILQQISQLNKQIVGNEVSGQTSNDLRDTRNNLLDELSGDMDISAVEQSDGSVTVKMEGSTDGAMLIDNNNTVHTLAVSTDGPTDSTGYPTTVLTWDATDANNQTGPYSTKDSTTGTYTASAVPVGGGKVNAYLNILDGNGSGITGTAASGASGTYGDVGVNYLKQHLNDFAKSFADIMNSVAQNTDDNGGNSNALALMYYNSANDAASTISLSSAWQNSKTGSTLFSDNYSGTSVGTYAQCFINALSTDKVSNYNGETEYTSGSLSGYAASFSNSIAQTVNNDNSTASNYDLTATNLDTQRQAVSSVSIDEETVNLMKFQQMYSASARVITTINDMMSTLLAMAQ